MKSNLPILLLLFVLSCLGGCTSCEDDNFDIRPQDDPCNGISCPYGAKCEEGACVCKSDVRQIAPGFCASPLYGDIHFVSYDTGTGCRDTAAIGFYDVDPYYTEWDWTENDIVDVSVYNEMHGCLSCLFVAANGLAGGIDFRWFTTHPNKP